jgi:hypothetical protein
MSLVYEPQPTVPPSLHSLVVDVDVERGAGAVHVHVTDTRPEALAAFGARDAAHGTLLAHDVWRVGLRAVLGAQRIAEESSFDGAARRVVDELERRLAEHAIQQERALRSELDRHLDPKRGTLPQRLDAFGREGGELTLALGRGLDPATRDSAAARFLASLREELSRAQGERLKQLDVVSRALDTTDPASPLSRLMAESRRSNDQLLRAINPASKGSALAVLKRSILEVFEQQHRDQSRAFEAFASEQVRGLTEVRDKLAKLDERRRIEAKTAQGGFAFEEIVEAELRRLVGLGALSVEAVTRTPGRSKRKVGDLVVRFTRESPFEGSGVVVEIKRDRSYRERNALDEIEEARQNRAMPVGLVVFAASHAPPGMDGLRRIGNDVLVVFDPETPSTRAYLEAALVLSLALAARKKGSAEQVAQRDALGDIEARVVKEVERHEAMRAQVRKILDAASELETMLGASDKLLRGLVGDAKKTLRALGV